MKLCLCTACIGVCKFLRADSALLQLNVLKSMLCCGHSKYGNNEESLIGLVD